MMDLLWYHFIRDLVGGSSGLLGYKNKTRLEMTSSLKSAICVEGSVRTK